MQSATYLATTADLDRFVHDFYADVEAGRLDRVDSCMDGGLQQLDERTGVWVRDRAGLIEGYRQELESAERYRNWIEDVDARLVAPDLGLVTYVWHADAAWDGTDYRIRCPSTMLARHVDGTWRILLIHSTPLEERSEGSGSAAD